MVKEGEAVEKKFYLVAPAQHHYELSTLIRQALPLAQIVNEPQKGIRGIVLSEGETKASLYVEQGQLCREACLKERSFIYQGEAENAIIWGVLALTPL